MSTAEILSFPQREPIPVLPEWTTNRTHRRAFARWAKSHVLHTTAYHAAHSHVYAGRFSKYAAIGTGRSMVAGLKWVTDWDSRPMRQSIIETRDAQHFIGAEKLHNQRIKHRSIGLGVGAVATGIGGLVLAHCGTGLEQLGVAGATVGTLGWIGKPNDAHILDQAHVPSEVRRITGDFIIEALLSLRINGLKETEQFRQYPAVMRDGAGFRVGVDLPQGFTAAQIVERREALAAALGRPEGAVWASCDTSVSPGHLVIWVGDRDMSTMDQGPWPLVDAKRVSFFDDFPLGTDQRGDLVNMTLADTNVLIGSIPGYGKTTALRAMLLAASLDPRSEIWIRDFKGAGDFDAFRPVATRYGSGPSDQNALDALEDLRALWAETQKRMALVEQLGEEAPEHKVTSELASRRDLHPLILAIDEVHLLFTNTTQIGKTTVGEEAGELAGKIIRMGRAAAVILLLATQKPNKGSLPTDVRDNVGTRLGFRVMDHTANDMILGTSAHQSGIKANAFTRNDRGMGYLLGQHDDAQIVRVFQVDLDAIKVIIERASAMRPQNSQTEPVQLSVVEGEQLEAEHSRNLLLDVRDKFEAAGCNLWKDELAELLGMDAKTMVRELEDAGLKLSRQVLRRRDIQGNSYVKAKNAPGYKLENVEKALEATK